MVYGVIGMEYKNPLIICENDIDDIEYIKIINESLMFPLLNEKYES